jgi:hypothetical protein
MTAGAACSASCLAGASAALDDRANVEATIRNAAPWSNLLPADRITLEVGLWLFAFKVEDQVRFLEVDTVTSNQLGECRSRTAEPVLLRFCSLCPMARCASPALRQQAPAPSGRSPSFTPPASTRRAWCG